MNKAVRRMCRVRYPLCLGVAWLLAGCAGLRPPAPENAAVIELSSNHLEIDGSRAVAAAEHQQAAQTHREQAQFKANLAQLYRSLSNECKRRVRHGKHAHTRRTACKDENEVLYQEHHAEAMKELGLAEAHEREALMPKRSAAGSCAEIEGIPEPRKRRALRTATGELRA